MESLSRQRTAQWIKKKIFSREYKRTTFFSLSLLEIKNGSIPGDAFTTEISWKYSVNFSFCVCVCALLLYCFVSYRSEKNLNREIFKNVFDEVMSHFVFPGTAISNEKKKKGENLYVRVCSTALSLNCGWVLVLIRGRSVGCSVLHKKTWNSKVDRSWFFFFSG